MHKEANKIDSQNKHIKQIQNRGRPLTLTFHYANKDIKAVLKEVLHVKRGEIC